MIEQIRIEFEKIANLFLGLGESIIHVAATVVFIIIIAAVIWYVWTHRR